MGSTSLVFGGLAARGGSATHRRSLRHTGRAAGTLCSLFLFVAAPGHDRQPMLFEISSFD